MIDATLIQSIDPRVRIATVLVLGMALWNTGWWGLACCAGMVLPVVAGAFSLRPDARRIVKGFILFSLFWSLLKLGAGAWDGVSLSQASVTALFFGIRLMLLLLLGLALALTTSARQIGQSLAWVFRPIIGNERAWRFALALALMVHFIPQCIEAVHQVRRTMFMRFPSGSFFRKMLLMPQMILRFMGQKTWNQTLAVTIRGLDRAEAWHPAFVWTMRDTATCLLVVLGAAVVFML